MERFINEPEAFAREYLEGLEQAHSEVVELRRDPLIVLRRDRSKKKVALVSGGGSGHEPLHAGFVGEGMLDVAVPGEVFTSPTPIQIQVALREADRGDGVLVIVKNYAGDIMNFEMSVEMAAADGIALRSVAVDDDFASGESDQGRRGVAGTMLVEKICGAAAERGDDLDAVAELAHRVAAGCRSVGVALSPCTPPALGGKSVFQLAPGEIELGIGIHGERGHHRSLWKPTDVLVAEMCELLFSEASYVRTTRDWDRVSSTWEDRERTTSPLDAGTNVLLMVNGMGGTPNSELYVVYRSFRKLCEARDLKIRRTLVGSYVTSLEMRGCSLTVLPVDDELCTLLDAPARTADYVHGR